MFSSEIEMIDTSIENLKNVFLNSCENVRVFQEVKGLFGVPDVVMLSDNNTVISIEFKLSNWKRALQQAFKYRSFSHESYVLLDEHFFPRARNNSHLFKRGNVGLGFIKTNGDIEIYYSPKTSIPFSQRMYEKLLIDKPEN